MASNLNCPAFDRFRNDLEQRGFVLVPVWRTMTRMGPDHSVSLWRCVGPSAFDGVSNSVLVVTDGRSGFSVFSEVPAFPEGLLKALGALKADSESSATDSPASPSAATHNEQLEAFRASVNRNCRGHVILWRREIDGKTWELWRIHEILDGEDRSDLLIQYDSDGFFAVARAKTQTLTPKDLPGLFSRYIPDFGVCFFSPLSPLWVKAVCAPDSIKGVDF